MTQNFADVSVPLITAHPALRGASTIASASATPRSAQRHSTSELTWTMHQSAVASAAPIFAKSVITGTKKSATVSAHLPLVTMPALMASSGTVLLANADAYHSTAPV
jgi:hypothetical protein